jgi:hypothetical protein
MDSATRIERIHLRQSVFICLYLRLKKENVLTADDNGLTLIHADEENRGNNSDPNRFDMIYSCTKFASGDHTFFSSHKPAGNSIT